LKPDPTEAVTAGDIRAASLQLKGQVRETPLLSHPWIDDFVGCTVVFKAEMLQLTGSFKYRGACNRLSRMTGEEKSRGVVAWSSGNHAQGVAAAAAQHGVMATIVMPADAPAIKIANTRKYGAEVVLYDRYNEVREEIAAGIVQRTGAIAVSPNDDPMVVAGYATVGLEMLAQAERLGQPLDALLAPCGGGGLVAGIGVFAAEHSPRTRVIAVEPADFDDTRRSMAAGERLRNDPSARSICDALVAPVPAALPFPLIQRTVAGVEVATDEEVRHAMKVAFERLKVVAEPGGAVGFAALLA
jgi:threonine dehydratase